MATVLSTLYPPLIDTFMPAFLTEGPAIVNFSISPYNSSTEIKRLHVSLVSQQSNLNAFAQSNAAAGAEYYGDLIDGIWVLSFEQFENYLSYNTASEIWTLRIPKELLRSQKNSATKSFSIDGYYKLQLRFDDSAQSSIDNNYLTTQRAHFSEWSSVCLLKAIPEPSLVLTKFDTDIDEEAVTVPVFSPGLIPVAGKVYFANNLSGTYEETMQSYQISIYPKDNPENIVDSIGPVYTGNKADQNNIYWLADCENIISGTIYVVDITIVTKNQYSFSKTYDFKVYEYDSTPFTPTFTFKKINLEQYSNLTVIDPKDEQYDIITEEDGAVVFTITTKETMPPGYLYIKRASSLDNYKKWELISCTRENGSVSRTIEDYTVGSLVRYKYSAQYQTKKGGWTRSVQYDANDENQNTIIYPDFYDMLLYRDGRQLAIRYDGQISSLRPTVNRQKIDTLGGKYPKFAENAKMNYKQFSISGLIDAESDFNRKFLDDRAYSTQMEDYNVQMHGKYEIRNDTIADGELTYPSSMNDAIDVLQERTIHDLYPKDNWWLEREFREQAIQWLNDGEPKLFRSMPEGNMAVMLMDISLTPNQTLGRRIYNFSATMYEIEDGYSLETLNSLGIFSIVNEKKIDQESSDDDDQSEDSDFAYRTITSIGQFPSKKFPGSGNVPASVVKGSMTGDTSEERGLDVDYISLEDLYNFIIYDQYSTEGKLQQLVPNTIKLKDVRLYFESKPKWYKFETQDITLVSETETFVSEQDNDNNIRLGYKIALNTSEKGNSQNDILVFVNEKGYYQVPTNLNITNIKIYDGATVSIDYKIEYKTETNNNLLPSTVELGKKIVGQLAEVWRPNTYLSKKMKDKYRWLYYRGSDLYISEYLDNWYALSLELTPYSVVSISFRNADNSSTDYSDYIVGRTGIYNLVDNFPIHEIIIKGKRMVKVEEERQNFLDDWEYVLDSSGIIYEDITMIKRPQSNTVYTIKDGENSKNMIYYQDGGWYEIDFTSDDKAIALAKVPVHGMINYWADIIRQTFN